jgi:GH24 family phage-related lysozyme (muramidase)
MTSQAQTLTYAAGLIERFEGIETEAYLDPIGIPTICAGITRYPNGDPVRMGDLCDARICRAHLESLLQREYIPKLQGIPGWARLGVKRQSVLLSFAWNLGASFYGSEGFETISGVLKQGAEQPEVYAQMPAALALYNRAGGGVLPGLVERRRQEGLIWSQEDDGIMKFIANQATALKKAPIDSLYLSEAGKKAFEAGASVSVARVEEIPADAQAWFILEGSSEKWAAYLPHWAEESTKHPAVAPAKVNWNDFTSPVSRYLTVGEVLQYDARRKPKAGSAEEKAILILAREFDAIREAWKGPIGVTSGYRPEPINSQVGGVPGSYHTKGMALDIYPIGESLQKFHQWMIQRWSGGYGDGRNKGFIHIDNRAGGKFQARAGAKPAVVWDY